MCNLQLMTKEPYTCPRCGYCTRHKAYMRRHLYQNKKTCPGTKSAMPLTDDIKDCILNDRIYHPPDKTPQHVIINQFNNFVSKMDPIQEIQLLENNLFEDFSLDHQKLLDVVDAITSCNSMDRLKIYSNGKWNSLIYEHGVMELMQKIQSFYLDYYELYLLKRAYTGGAYDRQCVRERLQDYYKFLVCFELRPAIKDQDDGDIMETDEDTTSLQDIYYPIFCELQEKMPLGEANRLRKKIHEVIKTNNKSSMLDLNKNVMEQMKIDEGFQQIVLEQIQKLQEQNNII